MLMNIRINNRELLITYCATRIGSCGAQRTLCTHPLLKSAAGRSLRLLEVPNILLCCAGLIGLHFFSVSPAAAKEKVISAELSKLLSFETEDFQALPEGWKFDPTGSVFMDQTTVRSGRGSARLEHQPEQSSAFTEMSLALPVNFVGKSITFRGFLRTEEVSGYAALWVSEDSIFGPLSFNSTAQRQLKGNNGWTQHSLTIPLSPKTQELTVGVRLVGTGKVWVDDLEWLVDEQAIWQAPFRQRPKTMLELDREFDRGSNIFLNELNSVQIENLVILAKVWGFLKYHHPLVTQGQYHWDYALLRVLPVVLAAQDRTAATAAIEHWVAGLGVVPECTVCARLTEENLYLRPDLNWINDELELGSALSSRLRSIYRNRSADAEQFYVSLIPKVRNPYFEHELTYASLQLPDAGFQMLALFRLWNAVEYWFPYRDLIGQDWDRVLARFLPQIALAKNKDSYHLALMAFIASLQDGHASLWNVSDVKPPTGNCRVPVHIRFIENSAVVAGFFDAITGPATGLEPGDVITALDDIEVNTLVERWRPYYAASNETARLNHMARVLTRGACNTLKLKVLRNDQIFILHTQRVAPPKGGRDPRLAHDLPGDTFRLLSDKVAYLKLSSVKVAEVNSYIEAARQTDGLIIDIRNYPSEFVVFALGSLLVKSVTPFARFIKGDLNNPGAFYWQPPQILYPTQTPYSGKVIVLVDETSISQAEYTSMALRAAPKALIMGSKTAGADGDVSSLALPGGLWTGFSGIGVFYPDKRPTQGLGIVPDIEVRPTIGGLRQGRDEVLEEALRQILGPQVPSVEIEAIVRKALKPVSF